MNYTNDNIAELFSYHPATPETTAKYEAINNAVIELAYLVNEFIEQGDGKQNAMYQLNIARMSINSAIANDVVFEHKLNEMYASEEYRAKVAADHARYALLRT